MGGGGHLGFEKHAQAAVDALESDEEARDGSCCSCPFAERAGPGRLLRYACGMSRIPNLLARAAPLFFFGIARRARPTTFKWPPSLCASRCTARSPGWLTSLGRLGCAHFQVRYWYRSGACPRGRYCTAGRLYAGILEICTELLAAART